MADDTPISAVAEKFPQLYDLSSASTETPDTFQALTQYNLILNDPSAPSEAPLPTADLLDAYQRSFGNLLIPPQPQYRPAILDQLRKNSQAASPFTLSNQSNAQGSPSIMIQDPNLVDGMHLNLLNSSSLTKDQQRANAATTQPLLKYILGYPPQFSFETLTEQAQRILNKNQRLYLPDMVTGKDRVGIGAPGALSGGNTFTRSEVVVDYDGIPRAYAPEDSGLVTYDNLGNAKDENGNLSPDVLEFEKRKINNQDVWAPKQDIDGYYFSRTAYEKDPNGSGTENYLNGNEIPYIALGKNKKGPLQDQIHGAKLGDYVFIKNEDNGKSTWAIYGDKRGDGNRTEISPRTARNLGLRVITPITDQDWKIHNKGHGIVGSPHLTVTVYPGSGYGIFPGK